MKVVEINDCQFCPYRNGANPGQAHELCMKSKRELELFRDGAGFTIPTPDWCELKTLTDREKFDREYHNNPKVEKDCQCAQCKEDREGQ